MSKKSTVATSPHEDEAREMLEAGWSPARVHAYLVERHGKDAGVPSEKALERYRAGGNVRPVKVLPTRLVELALKSLRRKVDVLRTVDDMIAFQEERLVWLRQREIESGEPIREVSQSLRVLDIYLERRQRLARELGLGEEESDRPTERDVPEGNVLPSWMNQEQFESTMAILKWHREEYDEWKESVDAQDRAKTVAEEAEWVSQGGSLPMPAPRFEWDGKKLIRYPAEFNAPKREPRVHDFLELKQMERSEHLGTESLRRDKPLQIFGGPPNQRVDKILRR